MSPATPGPLTVLLLLVLDTVSDGREVPNV